MSAEDIKDASVEARTELPDWLVHADFALAAIEMESNLYRSYRGIIENLVDNSFHQDLPLEPLLSPEAWKLLFRLELELKHKCVRSTGT